MAHELAHIKNYHHYGCCSYVCGCYFHACQFYDVLEIEEIIKWAGMLAMMIIAPLAASLIQMAISRSREYEADRVGAEICGNPMWSHLRYNASKVLQKKLTTIVLKETFNSSHVYNKPLACS